jgi:hypothetical protein
MTKVIVVSLYEKVEVLRVRDVEILAAVREGQPLKFKTREERATGVVTQEFTTNLGYVITETLEHSGKFSV